ncbi:MAG: hypothetical protein CL751_06135 [Chloroflexi bacterium]|nr:hypothetical protein [Chloroflexota bacterium]
MYIKGGTMKIIRARVNNYKSIDDSSWVDMEDVTALVGKNESGKTAFLQAIRKINSIAGAEDQFSIMDYPRKGYIRYKKIHETNPSVVAMAEFRLTTDEIQELESNFGEGVLNSDIVQISVNYNNERIWSIPTTETSSTPPSSFNIPSDTSEIEPPTSIRGAIDAQVVNSQKSSVLNKKIEQDFLEKWLPKFVYFDNYSTMRGKISINDLKEKTLSSGILDDADRTFMSLLTLTGLSLEDLDQDLGYEDIKVELESAAITITDEIFEYWQQNRELKVEFDLSQADPADVPPLNEGKILHVRIENARHRVTVSFDERSKGFVWFFSFLSYFSHLEETEEGDLIILLDEPGTALHAMAQQDFLRFMDERLAPKCQVIYSTHSPFMVDLKKLNRVRTVQDMDGRGTVVSNDAVENDAETLFPLQMALGYQMAQTLFTSPHCLMVNEASDLIYLKKLGELVALDHGSLMDPRWVVIPVGSSENLPTFVSLLGENYLSVAVMMDLTPTNKKRIERINVSNSDGLANPLKWVQVTRVRDADIEDLFEPSFYLKLVNLTYVQQLEDPLTMKLISESNPRIVERIKMYFKSHDISNGEFDRYKVATYLLENFDALKHEISEDTVKKIASLIQRINDLLPNISDRNGHLPEEDNLELADNLIDNRPRITM